LNQDNKFIDLPALRGFNHRIEDARVINRTTGPYLQLLVSPCEDEGSQKCSSYGLSSDCGSNANESSNVDSLAMDFFGCCESSEENTMDPLTMLEESNSTTPEHLNLAERYNKTLKDLFACETWTTSDFSISKHHFNSKEWTPPSSTLHLKDIQSTCSANGEKRTGRSHIKTRSGKTHVLDLGAGLFQIHDSQYKRKTPNPKYGISSFDFCNNFVALASV